MKTYLKMFMKTMAQTTCAILALMMAIATCVVGARIILALTKGIINISLCLEFLAIVVLMAVCIAIVKIISDSDEISIENDLKYIQDSIESIKKEDNENENQ